MVTSSAELSIAEQMDPRSMSESIELRGRPAAPRPRGERPSPRPPARSSSPPNGPHGQFMRPLGLAPGIDSVTASCDLGVLPVVTPIEQRAVQNDPPEAACFLTLGNQPCACVDPGAL